MKQHYEWHWSISWRKFSLPRLLSGRAERFGNSADRNDYFKNPVNKNEVPDYFDIVLNPMCWSMIEDRLDKHEYWDVQTFKVSLFGIAGSEARLTDFIERH